MTIENAEELILKLKQLGNGMDKVYVREALNQGAVFVRDRARDLAPRGIENGGALVRSIQVKMASSKLRSEVYTNYEPAVYVELGTGPNGQKSHQGISPNVKPRYSATGWIIPVSAMKEETAEAYGLGILKSKDRVYGYMTKGQAAQPFLYPALKNNQNKVNRIIADHLKTRIKENTK